MGASDAENRFRVLVVALHSGATMPPDSIEEQMLRGIHATHDTNLLELACAYASEIIQSRNTSDKAVARRLFEALSARGNHLAMFNLAISLVQGDGGHMDIKRSADLFEKLVFADDVPDALRAEARNSLAQCYHSARGRLRDMDKALLFWEQAADGGVVEAAFNVGIFYDELPGVFKASSPDFAKASKYYRKAAKAGHVHAATNLGLLLYKHHEHEESALEGMQWLEFAAGKGDWSAQEFLRHMKNQADLFLRDLDAGRIDPIRLRSIQQDLVKSFRTREVTGVANKELAKPRARGSRANRSAKNK